LRHNVWWASACPTSQPQEMRVRMNSTCLLG
jgi:hypothetical protein